MRHRQALGHLLGHAWRGGDHLRVRLNPAFDAHQALKHQTQRLLASARLVPVQIQSGFQARAASRLSPGSLCHIRQLPPLLTSNHAQSLAQSVPQKVIGIFDPTSAPQRTAVGRWRVYDNLLGHALRKALRDARQQGWELAMWRTPAPACSIARA